MVGATKLCTDRFLFLCICLFFLSWEWWDWLCDSPAVPVVYRRKVHVHTDLMFFDSLSFRTVKASCLWLRPRLADLLCHRVPMQDFLIKNVFDRYRGTVYGSRRHVEQEIYAFSFCLERIGTFKSLFSTYSSFAWDFLQLSAAVWIFHSSLSRLSLSTATSGCRLALPQIVSRVFPQPGQQPDPEYLFHFWQHPVTMPCWW